MGKNERKAKYCRNCGNILHIESDYCPQCGASFGKGNKYCQACGAQVSEFADVCVQCGASLLNCKPKSKLAAGLLALFLGVLGIHNFYLGYIGKGVIQLLITVLSGGFLVFIPAIWAFVECILIFTGIIDECKNGTPIE